MVAIRVRLAVTNEKLVEFAWVQPVALINYHTVVSIVSEDLICTVGTWVQTDKRWIAFFFIDVVAVLLDRWPRLDATDVMS